MSHLASPLWHLSSPGPEPSIAALGPEGLAIEERFYFPIAARDRKAPGKFRLSFIHSAFTRLAIARQTAHPVQNKPGWTALFTTHGGSSPGGTHIRHQNPESNSQVESTQPWPERQSILFFLSGSRPLAVLGDRLCWGWQL